MLYRILWFTIGPPIRLWFRIRIVGRRNVPRHGGFVLASNHRAAVDPIIICMSFVRAVQWLAKRELVKSVKTAWFFRLAQVIPVDRSEPDDVWMRKAARGVVRYRKIFGLFPEGTRSPDGRVYRGYTGVARIAEMTGKPVVPTAVLGSDRSHQKGKRMAKSVRTEVRFGVPLSFERLPGEEPADAYRRFTDEVMERVAELAGTVYVRDEYSRKPVRST